MTFNSVNTPESTANFVQNRWAYFRDHADELLALAVGSALDLNEPVAHFAPFNVNFNLDIAPEYGTFLRPTAPVLPTFLESSVTVPVPPVIGDVDLPKQVGAPVEPNIEAYLNYSPPGAEPIAPIPPSSLDAPVVLYPVTIPDYVQPPLPEMGELYPIVLPEVPIVTIPPFTSERPVFDVVVPDNTFAYVDEEYTSELIVQMQTKLSEIMTGGTGLPVAVENSLFEQARSRDSKAAHRLRTSTADELASRGLSEPNGLLARRLLEIEQDVQDKANATSREIFIDRHKQEIDQLNSAIQQGTVLEGVLIQQQIATNDRRLKAAQIGVEMSIAIFNAEVAAFNAEVQAYSVDAEVYKNLIEAEMAKVELYKAQIDAQVAIGQLNETLVRAYTEQVRAVVAMAEIYKTQVDAARVQMELNTQLLEAKRVEVQTYSARVEAYSTEWEGYKTQVESRLGSMRAGELLLGMYGQRVQAYSTIQNTAFEGARLLFAGEQLKNTQYMTSLEHIRAKMSAEALVNETRAKSFEAQARIYESEGRITESEANVRNAVAMGKVTVAQAEAELQVKNADASINQMTKLLDAEIAANKGKTDILAQLASSVLSGFNFGANLQASASDSYSYSKQVGVNYSAGGPPITFAIGGI